MSLSLGGATAAASGLRELGTGGFGSTTVPDNELRLLVDNMPALAWVAAADGSSVWYNRRMLEYCGKTAEQMQGWGWQSVHDPAVLPHVLARWRASIAVGSPFEMTFPLRGGDGVFRPFLTRSVPIRGLPEADVPEGRILRWFGTNIDVSAQVDAEQRLRELVGTLDLAAIMVRDLAGTIRFWSKGCETLYGWTVEEATGQNAHELLQTKFPVSLAEVEAALLCHGEWHGDLRHMRRDGTPLIAAARKVLRRDEAGRPVAVMESLSDVTALRRTRAELEKLNAELEARVASRTAELMATEADLRQAQKMEAVGQLTGGLAHDFNNLLTGISGSLERLQARAAQGRLGEAGHYITLAQDAAKRAGALTHRLLAFSRRQTLDPKPTNVNGLVAGLEELVRRTVGPAIAVEVVGAGGLWTTLIDPGQLENALLNLCINARDAMPEGGRLTIESGNRQLDEGTARILDLLPGQYVSLCVSDTGSGMTPDVIARAFDPFFTTKPIGMGTGLGLSMVYGFARQSAGQARIYSEPGQGTTVCLYLPRYYGRPDDDTEEAVAVAASAAKPHAAQNRTVLVVDDEPTVRMLVTEVIQDLGYTAVEAADGPAGLRVLHSDIHLDLLISDVGLPGGINGRQVADAGRTVRPGLKVLFITGYAETAVVGNGHLDPGMHVLTKPFAMNGLAARVQAIMEAP
jgi:PAS domain S-box-containing protein